ncbi:serine hydrolase domain-containing protein [Luteimonas sp. RIT-PG2_3]
MLAVAQTQAVNADAAAEARLDVYAEQALKDWQTPGMTLAVVKRDRVVLAKGYGVREIGRPLKVDARTMFALGSTSKAFASAAVAMLISDGSIAWEDRVKLYLPWLELYDPWVTQQVTVRDLLAHRVGTSIDDENKLRPVSRDARDLLERGRWLRPRAEFRADFVYSNNMMTASGLVVSAVSGQRWPDFARDRIWSPLGMTRTNADVTVTRADRNAAVPHVGHIDKAPVAIAWDYPDAVAVPSGGINSNAVDMAQWLRFQLGDGAIDGKRLIKADVFQQMHMPQTPLRFPLRDVTQFPGEVQTLAGMHAFAYGLGWYVTQYRGRKMLWHSGTIEGFRAGVALLPEEGIAVYANVNRIPSTLPFAMILRVFDEYLDERPPPTDWSRLFLDSALREER